MARELRKKTGYHWCAFPSTVGKLLSLQSEDRTLLRLEFVARLEGGVTPLLRKLADRGHEVRRAGPLANPVREQIGEYLAGERTRFELKLATSGTPFQEQVWKALKRIRYGRTTTYPDLAFRAGNEAAIRATGLANATNPVALVIPCHRVTGVDGSLRGYGGGLDVKLALIEFERREGKSDLRKLLARARRVLKEGTAVRADSLAD